MSEPNAGSDVVSMKLKAEKKGEATRHGASGKGRKTNSDRGSDGWEWPLLGCCPGSRQGGSSSVD